MKALRYVQHNHDGRSACKATGACSICNLAVSSLCRAVEASGLAGTRPARRVVFKKNTMLSEERASPGFTGIVKRGVLRKERITREGMRSIVELAFPGDLVGALPGRQMAFSLEAATDAELCLFDDNTIRIMSETAPEFLLTLLRQTSRQLENQRSLIWQRGLLTSRERVIAFLVQATRFMPVEPQSDGSLIVTMEVSRRDWADLTNTTLETISRTVSLLTERGLIETVAPGRYLIHDLDALVRMACLDTETDAMGAGRTTAQRPCSYPWSRGGLTAVNDRAPQIPSLVPMSETAPPVGAAQTAHGHGPTGSRSS